MNLPSVGCDVCERPISGRRYMEMREVAVAVDEDGRTSDYDQRTKTCSPACTLTAQRTLSERAWGALVQR